MTKEELMEKAVLDGKVLDAIRSGLTRAGAIQGHLMLAGSGGMRDIDKSLQRLRRRGFIVYGDASRETAFFGWRVVGGAK